MLPEGEREATARALAKEPRGRWGSCRAFVEALRSGVPAQDRSPRRPGPSGRRRGGRSARRGEGGVVVAEGPEGSASPGRPAPVSPPVHWGARPEVSHRRSPTAMSDRGRKVLALSLTALSSSLVLVLGLWALGVLAPSQGDSRGTPSSTPVAPPSDTRPKGPATTPAQALPSFQGGGCRAGAPKGTETSIHVEPGRRKKQTRGRRNKSSSLTPPKKPKQSLAPPQKKQKRRPLSTPQSPIGRRVEPFLMTKKETKRLSSLARSCRVEPKYAGPRHRPGPRLRQEG